MPRYTETQLQKYLVKNLNTALPRAKFIEAEKRLYPFAYEFGEVKPQQYFGRVDLIMRYNSVTYAVEIKNYNRQTKKNNTEFWEALKVLGYTEYLNWQAGKMAYRPAMIIPLEKVTREFQIIAHRLKIKVFGVIKKGEEYEIKAL